MTLAGFSVEADATANMVSMVSSGKKRRVKRCPDGNRKDTFKFSPPSAGSGGISAIGSFGISGSATVEQTAAAGAGAGAAAAAAATGGKPVSSMSPEAPLGSCAGLKSGLANGDILGELDMECWSRNENRYSAAASDSTHFLPSQDLTHRFVLGSTMAM